MANSRDADLVIDSLHAVGVRHIYGVVGDSLYAITDALRKRDDMEWIHTRHEETAAFAAGAESAMPPAIKLEQVGGFGPWALKTVLNGRGDELVEVARAYLRR